MVVEASTMSRRAITPGRDQNRDQDQEQDRELEEEEELEGSLRDLSKVRPSEQGQRVRARSLHPLT